MSALCVETWTDELVERNGLTVVDAPFVTVGGGIASFTLVDLLRVTGTPAESIRIISPHRSPDALFRSRCHASGIRDGDPLRSDSSARPDNVWGFPGYAVEHAIRGRTMAPLWQVLAEPVFCEHYTPTLGLVHSGLRREAERIGWTGMLVDGVATVLRRRADGGYFVLVEPTGGGDPVIYRCRFVHLALGYAGLRFTEDAERLRTRFPANDLLVHAYEPHEHVYRSLAMRPGAVLVRGAGIAASRVLQRLIECRDQHGVDVRIKHLFRSYADATPGPPWFRRHIEHGFTHQAFNFPKAAGGGQLRDRVRTLPDTERAELIRSIGGTSTPYRRQWAQQLRRGREEGWYRAIAGRVTKLTPDRRGFKVRICDGAGKAKTISVDFVIDATGLEPEIRRHSLLADLLDVGGAGTNALGGLDVAPDFEVRGTASGHGRVHASGIVALGGYLAPVDSFAGMQHAAQLIADSLARHGLGQRLGPLGSATSWWRWMRNRTP